MKSLLLFCIFAISTAAGYHILCIQKAPTKSHNHLLKGIVDPLLKAGHEVTFITHYPDGKTVKNLNIIDASHMRKLKEGIDIINSVRASITLVKDFGKNLSLALLDTPVIHDAVAKGNYDAVVTEWFFSDVEAGYASVLQVPWILLSGTVLYPHLEYLVDTVRSIPNVPSFVDNYSVPMTFRQRFMNAFIFVMSQIDYYWNDFPSQKAIYESRFGPIAKARGVPLPPYEEAYRNVSILLVNSHPSFAPTRSLPPNVIDIAGYHIDATIPPLPKDLQDILDGSPQGVIYFSMGSVVKSAQLEEKTRKELIKVFGEVKQTVLWKFEEKIDGLPKNVHVRPWMPQPSILAHPNVKLFITHGGLLSTLESLQYGVPLLAIPVFGDQPGNAHRSVVAGHALKVDFSPDMAPKLKEALHEMMRNDSYYNKAKYISKLFHNRPTKPTDLITHYVEMAIESQGAYHLRSSVNQYKWYENWMLDIIFVILAALYVVLYIIKKVIKSFTKKEKKQKKN
ncbi:UDP-glucosyltransferase 2-like [Zerene cesonia]|uniref:UDP-glucosyltransferase 2-like n=1 Tax=Zerene cesonia TaxID=33412 RepID=UPI0018E57944|nr:UDP-glucosyltransferase 2-like [Zerene cesonia]